MSAPRYLRLAHVDSDQVAPTLANQPFPDAAHGGDTLTRDGSLALLSGQTCRRVGTMTWHAPLVSLTSCGIAKLAMGLSERDLVFFGYRHDKDDASAGSTRHTSYWSRMWWVST
jgi:hypothetical protein